MKPTRRFTFLAIALLLWPVCSFAQMAPGTLRARLYDSAGNGIDSATAAPAGTERGIITRPIISQLPTSLVGSRLDVNVGAWLGSTAPTVGQKTMASSIPVVLSSDHSNISTTVGAFTSLATFQQAVTATAAALPANAGKSVCIRTIIGGTQTVYFGPSTVTTTNGQVLEPGDSWCKGLDNSNRIYVIASGTGTTVAGDVEN